MDKCELCGQTELWHEEHHPRHEFASPDGTMGDINKKEEPGKVSVSKGLSTDPALRIALVEAGVITYAQIMAAEEKLRDAAGRGQAIVIDTLAGGSGDAANGHAVSVVAGGGGENLRQGD